MENVIVKKRRTITTINPINKMVLIRSDKPEDKSPGGILLPESSKIIVLTGIIAAMPQIMKENEFEYPFQEGDRVVYDIREAIPYKLDSKCNHYLLDASFILAVVHEEEIEEDE